MIKQKKSLSPRQRGATLLEVMVATVIVSIGLLGLAGMQATGVKSSYGAFLRAQGTQFAYDMLDRMRANRAEARNGLYNLTIAGDPPVAATTIANRDLIEWAADLATLPQGDGSVNVVNDVVTIVVQWNDSRAGGAAAANITVISQL